VGVADTNPGNVDSSRPITDTARVKVLLTGASSYVGAFVATRLAERQEVIATFRRTNHRVRELSSKANVRLIQLDLADPQDFVRLPRDVDAVVHNAATFPWTDVKATDVALCNVAGTAHLVEWAAELPNLARFIHYSTISVYGPVSTPTLEEARAPAPDEIYGSSKLAAEHLVDGLPDRLAPTHLRFPVVLGNGSHRAFIPLMADAMTRDDDVHLRNPQSPYNAMTTLPAVADLTMHLLENRPPASAVNLGAHTPMTIMAIAQMLRTRIGSRSRIIVAPEPSSCYLVTYDGASRIGYFAPSVAEALHYYCESSGWSGR
jgi:nucleoside-diphosphate-sugar epimerase